MAHFRFRFVFIISRYIMDQSELVIAQIKAEDLIKVFYFASWGLGSLGVFGVIGGQNSNIFNLDSLYIKMKLLLP